MVLPRVCAFLFLDEGPLGTALMRSRCSGNFMSERVLVTGASRGIGRAIALRLARDGFELLIGYRSNQGAAEEVLASIEAQGGSARLMPFDVSDRAACQASIAAEIERAGAPWGVVLNAGVTADAPLASMSSEQWDRVIDTNLSGFYNVLQPLIMPMVRLRRGGRIVCISSVGGLTGNRGQSNYAASKAGLMAASRSLALELGKRRITVNSIAPGYVATDMLEGLELEQAVQRVPLGRIGQPEEVAEAAGFLFSEGAAYITGQVLSVDGGMA